MKVWRIVLVFLLMLSIIIVAAGCQKEDPIIVPGDNLNPDSGEDDPGIEPEDDPDPDPLAVTPIPGDKISLVDKAVIQLGDLWLGTADQFWRQTDTSDVRSFVWAPDGHGLVFFRSSNPNQPGEDLYYLALGQAPVFLDKNVLAYTTWFNKTGWLWSPDSDVISYAVGDGSEIIKARVQDMTRTKLTLNKPSNLGPYWLTNSLMVYGTGAERPELIIINSLGQVQRTITDADLPYLLPEGMIIATGEYDPDGIMDTFYYTGLARTNADGSSTTQIYDESARFHLLAKDPIIPNDPMLPKYLAMSNTETLFLQQYDGIGLEGTPARIELLTQDLFLTYSEFAYPLWFSWAPNGNNIAALTFTLTKSGDFGEQEGYWNLVLVDKEATQDVVLERIYTVSGDQQPVPFQSSFPLNWSNESTHINYLRERKDGQGHDWWQVKVATGELILILEKSGLPEYRPEL